MPRLLRRVVVAVLVAVSAGLAAPVTASAAPGGGRPAAPAVGAGPSRPIVLVGTSGLRWDDLDAGTPALAAVLSGDATANLVVRSVDSSTCPVDGWLAVSAGRRAGDVPGTCRTPSVSVVTPGGPGTVADWATYRRQAFDGTFDADPGLLGTALADAGRRVAAVGPGAAIALADRTGRVPRLWPGLPASSAGIDPAADAVGLADQVRAAAAGSPDVLAVDLGSVRDPAGDRATPRAEQVAALDSRLGLVLDALPPAATVVIASLADSGTAPRLQVAAMTAPGTTPGGLLRTASTRQDGLVQSTDLLPTLAEAAGAPVPVTAVGSPLRRVDAGGELDRRRALTDLAESAVLIQQVAVPFWVTACAAGLALMLLLGLLARGNRHRAVVRRRALVLLQLAAIGVAGLPLASFLVGLVPWWRWPAPTAAVLVTGFVATLPGVPLALAGPWRRALLGPAAAVGALVLAGLTADLATGSRLQLVALVAGQPLVGGRFYGLSNPTFAIFATGGLVLALGVARALLDRGRSPLRAGAAVAAVGVLVTAVDAAPFLGSDFGGPPATVPAFGLLALWTAGVRVTWRRLLGLAVGTVALLVTVAVGDWLRPASDRTHLGRFVQSVLDGDARATVSRKAAQNLEILTSSPVMLLIPVGALVVAAALRWPERFGLSWVRTAYAREPLLPRLLAAVGVLVLLGFAANDSGTSIPPAAFLLLAPLLVAVCARAVQLDEAERLDREVRRAARGKQPR